MTTFDERSYWEGRLASTTGLEGVGFQRLGQAFNRRLYRLRREVFCERIRAAGVDVEGAEVLDVGSGTGFYVDRWHELGARKVVGIDLTDVAVSQLRARFPNDEFHQADIGRDDPPLREASFTAASCFDVFFHVVDDERLERGIAKIASLVRPGGFFALSDFFVHKAPLRPFLNKPHRVLRTLDQMTQVLDRSGFEIVDRRPMLYLLNEPVDSRNWLRTALWFAIGGLASTSNIVGGALGAMLYPIESSLVSRRTESPSTEMMICRKR